MTTLAIDIGGTKIAAAVCDENDSIIQRCASPRRWMPTPSTSTSPRCTARLWPPDTPDIEAIGISAAGNVSADRKTLTFSANIPAWINYDLSEHVAR